MRSGQKFKQTQDIRRGVPEPLPQYVSESQARD